MIRIVDTPSCGLFYLGGETNYKTAETYFKDLAGIHFGPKPKTAAGRDITKATLFVWTHPPKIHGIGGLMKAYIEKHDLGVVVESPKGKNYLHGEHDGAVVWTWVRDNTSFEKHCKELLCTSNGPATAGLMNSTVSGNSLLEMQHLSLPPLENCSLKPVGNCGEITGRVGGLNPV